MDWQDSLQWPALVITVIAAWMVSSNAKRRRETGFWCFLVSNILWALWGWQDGAYALILLQFFLAFSNVHGVIKNRD
ncbi:MAG TPA: hypothetical protein VM553_17630 [Dongiaceae bacterium]|nr:hypothetical protein [Dongiaceae bacterium]